MSNICVAPLSLLIILHSLFLTPGLQIMCAFCDCGHAGFFFHLSIPKTEILNTISELKEDAAGKL